MGLSDNRKIIDASQRLDVYVAQRAGVSRSLAARWIEGGYVCVPHLQKLRPSTRIIPSARVSIHPPKTVSPPDFPAKPMQLSIIYEDADILVVDKPPHLSVHPGAGHWDDTLVNGLLHHTKGALSSTAGAEKPGIVHRIDKDTSGLLVVAKHDRAHDLLAQQFADRKIFKRYLAIARGVPLQPSGSVEGFIHRHPHHRKKMISSPSSFANRGKWAKTHYRILAFTPDRSFCVVELTLETGRTHQIRVHMTSLGHPLLGDKLYGGPTNLLQRQALHASQLGFRHPTSGEYLHFTSKLPEDLRAIAQRCIWPGGTCDH